MIIAGRKKNITQYLKRERMNNFWKDKNVLVTGAEGFIGSHLTEELVRQGAKVRAFVFYNSFGKCGWLDDSESSILEKIDIFSGDVRDPNKVTEAVNEQEIVFHLASLVSIPYSYQAPDSYIETNVKGTLNVLNACRAAGIKRIIHTSTSEVYGTALYVPIDEKHPLQSQSPYSASKIAADSIVLSYYYSFGLPVAVLRPFNTFGPRQSARAVIPTIISQIYSGGKTIELGDLTPTRDFNFVMDTVDGFIKLGETAGVEGEVFNVGSEREISIKDLVELITKITGEAVEVVSKTQRLRPQKSEVRRLLSDSSKIKNKCNWKPNVGLESGLEITCKWIKDNLNTYRPLVYNV